MIKYGEDEINYLKSKDKVLKKVIENIGMLNYELNSDFFATLVQSIIGQQISNAAANKIWERFLNKYKNKITPKSIVKTQLEEIKVLGVSLKKATYIKNAAEKIVSGELDIKKLENLDDDEVMNELIKLDGVGKWTAEMLMIFSLGRLNILSYGDLTIIRALKILHNHENVDKKLFEKYKELYSPYCSIASFYLWYVAEGKCDNLENIIKI